MDAVAIGAQRVAPLQRKRVRDSALVSAAPPPAAQTRKGLTQFGDRRQGTDRNRKAVEWIEAQLKSYGCTNTGADQIRLPATAAARV
jgi:hypothetical protein